MSDQSFSTLNNNSATTKNRRTDMALSDAKRKTYERNILLNQLAKRYIVGAAAFLLHNDAEIVERAEEEMNSVLLRVAEMDGTVSGNIDDLMTAIVAGCINFVTPQQIERYYDHAEKVLTEVIAKGEPFEGDSLDD